MEEIVEEVVEDIEIEIDPDQFEQARDQLVRELERQLHASFDGLQEGERVYRLLDPLIQKAIDIMPQASRLVHRCSPLGTSPKVPPCISGWHFGGCPHLTIFPGADSTEFPSWL